MLYLAIGGALLAFYIWRTRGKPRGREWQVVTGVAALAAFTGAAFAGVRGGWAASIVLTVVGLWLASMIRKPAVGTRPPPAKEPMSEAEARRILGVGPEATKAEVQAAYTRLMRTVHPDKGGTAGLAAQLNAARDRLLSK